MNIFEIMTSPLTQKATETSKTGPFLRLVLAEAASYGMPPQVVATLDDVASMLGFYEPLASGQSRHVAGPLVRWQTHHAQPTHESVSDVEGLAMKQRALIAFGGAPLGHMVGTAEIVCAMGNLHEEFMPKEYYRVFHWASVDVLAVLQNKTHDALWAEKQWDPISDDEVLKPGGSLYPTYQEIATSIRRTIIEVLTGTDNDPRANLRPLAEFIVTAHDKVRANIGTLLAGETVSENGKETLLKHFDEQIANVRQMFPDVVPVTTDDAEEVPAK